MHERIAIAYILLGLLAGSLLTALIISSHRPVVNHPRLGLITDDSGPAAVDAHFKGNGYASGPASSLGMKDGTCWAYGNKVSWMVIKCFGGVAP